MLKAKNNKKICRNRTAKVKIYKGLMNT